MAEQVTAPVRNPRIGGIKGVVPDFSLIPRLSLAPGVGGVAWEDATCGFPAETKAGCYTTGEQLPKVGNGPEQYTSISDPFAQYKGVECWIGGDNEGDSYETIAARALEAGEERLIEDRLHEWASAGTTATATNVSLAIGAAEDHADANYVGRPILLMNRGDVLAAAGVLDHGDELKTKNGTMIVSTSSVPAGELAIVGAIAVYASATRTYLGRELGENLAMGLAERIYAVGVDCGFRYGVTYNPLP